VALGAFLCKWGYDLDLGTLSEPGSGFIIFWMGIVTMGLSVSIFFLTFFQKIVPEQKKSLWSGVRWRKLIFVLVSLLLYAYALIPLGFLLSTCLLLILLFKGIEPQKWSVAVTGAILTVLITYAIFHLWLGSQLPKGILVFIIE
jgi:putative tricarboxylic transport membrane protein